MKTAKVFGKCSCLIFLSLVLAGATVPRGRLLMAVAPASGQGTGCAGDKCLLYLPLVAGARLPSLVSPIDGAQVVSLAPLLSWTPVISGSYQLQVSVDPSFTQPFVSTTNVWAPLPAQVTFVFGSNLNAATVFYWRVGLYQSGSYLYSPNASFTTPSQAPGSLPPPPTLLAPPNHARLATNEVTLSWRSVPGALYYRIVVDTPYGTQLRSSITDASMTTLHVTGLAPGTTYKWEVKTLNQFGWGNYQTEWSFTTS